VLKRRKSKIAPLFYRRFLTFFKCGKGAYRRDVRFFREIYSGIVHVRKKGNKLGMQKWPAFLVFAWLKSKIAPWFWVLGQLWRGFTRVNVFSGAGYSPILENSGGILLLRLFYFTNFFSRGN